MHESFVTIDYVVIVFASIKYIVHSVTVVLSRCLFFLKFIFQILPVNIKGLAGSIATLANWLTSWAITMTANLLLTWSGGGLSLSLSLSLSHLCLVVCANTVKSLSITNMFASYEQELSLFMQLWLLSPLFLWHFGSLKQKEEV